MKDFDITDKISESHDGKRLNFRCLCETDNDGNVTICFHILMAKKSIQFVNFVFRGKKLIGFDFFSSSFSKKFEDLFNKYIVPAMDKHSIGGNAMSFCIIMFNLLKDGNNKQQMVTNYVTTDLLSIDSHFFD